MKVFYGSSVIVGKADITFSRGNLDFGKGFYLTSYRAQAESWAKRKALRKNKSAVVNVYEMQENLSDYHVLRFDDDRIWIEFVCKCRRGEEEYKCYDIIIGNVADDKVYAAVDMYYRNLWDIERTLEELKYYEANDQYCIVSQAVIDKSLIY